MCRDTALAAGDIAKIALLKLNKGWRAIRPLTAKFGCQKHTMVTAVMGRTVTQIAVHFNCIIAL